MSFISGGMPLQFTPGKGDPMPPGQIIANGDWTTIPINPNRGDVTLSGLGNPSGDWMPDVEFTKGKGDSLPGVQSGSQPNFSALEEQASLLAARFKHLDVSALKEAIIKVNEMLIPMDAGTEDGKVRYNSLEASKLPKPDLTEKNAEDAAEYAHKFPWMAASATQLAREDIHFDWGSDWDDLNSRLLRAWVSERGASGVEYETTTAHNRAFKQFTLKFYVEELESLGSASDQKPAVEPKRNITNKINSVLQVQPGRSVFDAFETNSEQTYENDAYDDDGEELDTLSRDLSTHSVSVFDTVNFIPDKKHDDDTYNDVY